MTRLKLFVLFLIAMTATARAELSPVVYRNMQDLAGEVLMIVPAEVTVTPSGKRESVMAKAKVTKVIRSTTGVTVDQVITITYQRNPPKKNTSGPAPVPILEKHREVHAFLMAIPGGMFTPVAQGRSFEPLIDVNAGAAERLTIAMTQVKQSATGAGNVVQVQATVSVTAVEKTATDLKPGSEITLVFPATTTPVAAMPLPAVPAEKSTWNVSAYRQPDGNYALVAEKWSLEPVTAGSK